MTTVKIQNVNATPFSQWVMCGLPTPVPEQHLLVGPYRAYAREYELHVFAALPAASEQVETTRPGPAVEPPPFALHPWVADDLPGLVPTFTIVLDGQRVTAGASILSVKLEGVVLKVHLRALIPRANVVLDGHYRIYTDSPIVEYVWNATYGTVAPGQPRMREFGSLSMVLGEYTVVDFAIAKGLHAPAWSPVGDPLRWEVELCAPMVWHRAATVEVFGAILCLPASSRFPTLPGNAEVANMQARMFAPLTMMVDPAEWAGNYGPLGVLPEVFTGAGAEQGRFVANALARLSTAGSEHDPRLYGQPPNSGQTGEQPDFGYARAPHAVSTWSPFALWILRYHAQAWKLRPYANKEPDGSPVRAVRHPNARTYNLRPDERFSRADMLGWPDPVGWISGYTTSDSQHRSDNLLFGLYQLTRCPSLCATIFDILELEKMAYGRGVIGAPGSGLGAPRGWGRVLYARLQGVAAGFHDFAVLAREIVQAAAVQASYTTLPVTDAATVRVLSSGEEKYGWKDQQGQPIRCWLPWQEAIAVVAFYAAWKVLAMPEARDLALTAARTIARHAYFKVGDQWHVCYGVRWRTDAPGEPLPDSAYNLTQPNYDVFVTGMQRWTNPALKVLLALEPDAPEAARAREILAHYGPAKSWDDACWGAV